MYRSNVCSGLVDSGEHKYEYSERGYSLWASGHGQMIGLRAVRVAPLLFAVGLVLAGCSTDPPWVTGSDSPSVVQTPSSVSTSSPSRSSPTTGSPAASPTARSSGSSGSLIDHVVWTSTARGRQLQVFPTRHGRVSVNPADRKRAWDEVLHKDGKANIPGMQDQFYCHWDFARIADRNKPSWNLEPWRPVVGYRRTVEAACNPGGAEE